MKNQKLIRIMALIIVIVLAITPSFSALASSDLTYKRTCPTIKVNGFMSNDIYKNIGTQSEEKVFGISGDVIFDLVKDCIPALARFVVDRDWDKLGETVTPIASACFEDIMLDSNGEPKDNSGAKFIYPEPNEIKKDSVLPFKYDWRLDPLVIAKELNDYIDYVLECSGAEKVALDCHSLGGVIVITYVSVYGYEKIHGVVFNSTAIYGETYTGELLTGQLVLSKESVTEYLRYVLDQTEYENLINGIIDILSSAGIFNALLPLADDIILNLSEYLIPEVFAPIFGGWLTIWAMIPDEYIDEAMDYIFNDVYEGSDEYNGLIEKIENYNNTVRKNKTETVKETEKNCRVGVYSRYGYSSILVTPSWQNVSDGTIDTKYASFGATTAKYGEKLSDEYLANVDEKYISPDKTIDASTCLFPEKTWFVKYLKHADNCKNLQELTNAILFADETVTVDTYESYPQYLINDTETDVIRAETENDNMGIYEQSTFLKIFTYLIELVRRVLESVINFI